MGRAAGFHDDQTDIAIPEPALELAAGQSLRFDHAPLAVGDGHLEYAFGKINGNGSSIHFGFPFGVESC